MKLLLAAGAGLAALFFAQAAEIPRARAQEAPSTQADWMKYRTPYAAGEQGLSGPHHTTEEVSIWAQQVAADALSFSPANYGKKMEDLRRYFTPPGWELYQAYLKNSKLDGTATVTSIVSSGSEIVSHGAVEGVYHWIVKSPVTTSFSGSDAGGQSVLYMDVARAPEGGGDDGLIVYNWRVDAVSTR